MIQLVGLIQLVQPMQTVASVEPVELVEAHSMLQLHQSGTLDCPNQSIHVKQALDKEYGDIFQPAGVLAR